jgi:hypothetical protein
MSVAILYLVVSLQQVAVVAAKEVIHQQLTAVLAVVLANSKLGGLVIRLALHHHKATMVVTLRESAEVLEAVALVRLAVMLDNILVVMVALVLLQALVAHLKPMLAAAVAALKQLEAQTLVEQAAQTLVMGVQNRVEQWVTQLLQLPILVAVAVVVEQLLVMVVQALWLFVMQTLSLMPYLLQDHPHSPLLVDSKFTNGLHLVQLHSEAAHGALCTT